MIDCLLCVAHGASCHVGVSSLERLTLKAVEVDNVSPLRYLLRGEFRDDFLDEVGLGIGRF